MIRIFATILSGTLLLLAAASAGMAQGQGGGGGGSSPGQPGTSGNTGGGQQRPAPTRPRPPEQLQGPMFVSGRVVMETGRPISEPVSVELNCGLRPVQVIHTDLGGYFTFSLNTSFQSNIDFSASNESPAGFGNSPMASAPRGFGGSMTGCELRITVPGYHPLTHTLTQHADMGRIEVGTLRLRRVAGVEGSAISVTSLLVPNDARKEYEKAIKELRNNRLEAARPHLVKAIALYDKYAAAWNELGKIHQSGGDKDKAQEAFAKAIEIDPQYIQPYLNLAFLQVQAQQWQAAVETAGRALEMDGSIGLASFLQAVGNYNLQQFAAAEKSARNAEKAPHESLPQVHALLAQIFLQREAYPEAANEMRTYLQEAPQGQYAEQMKKDLEEIQTLASSSSGDGSPATEEGPQ